MKTSQALSVAFFLAIAGWQTSAIAAAGKVVFALGEAYTESATGTKQDAVRNLEIANGDTLVTGTGRMQVRMSDGGFIALQPGTRFKIENYNFSGGQDGSESAIFGLISGGIRAITGLIGKRNQSAFRLNTAVATIGIRGTTFKVLFCAASCPGMKDGLYAGGGEGSIFVQNEQGVVDLTTGQNAYVADASSAPQFSDIEPVVGDINTSDTAEEVVESATNNEFIAGEVVFQGSTSGVSAVSELYQGAIAYSGSIILDDELEEGFGTASGVRGSDLSSLVGLFNSDNGLIGVAGINDEDEVGAFFFTNSVDTQTDGVLYVGRWTQATGTAFAGDGFSESVELDVADNVHYVVGTEDVTMPMSGAATYGFGIGTSSTGTDGSIGQGITAGQVEVDFGAQIVLADFTVSHGGTYDVSAFGFLGFSEPEFGASGSAMGPGCADYCSVGVDGFLSGAGEVPTRTGLAYEIVTDANVGITGVGGFSLQSTSASSSFSF